MSNFRLDAHKLIFHTKEVSDWLAGGDTYPINVEVGLSNLCNHRCTFCAVDYSEYKSVSLDKDVILKTLKLLRAKNLKSVVFSGEGEPLLNKNAPEIINQAKNLGLDVAMSTNGVLLTQAAAKTCLGSLTWIRFSVAAATAATYAKIHRTQETDFALVLQNIKTAVEIKRKNNYTATIGVQLLLLPENSGEVILLAEKLKEIGVDYFTVKPYSQHPSSLNKNSVDYEKLANERKNIEQQLAKLTTDSYKIYFRANAIEKLAVKRPYDSCFGLEFITYIDARGNVIPCIMYLGNDQYKYGNLYEEDILTIWQKRREIIRKINGAGLANCREICRLDEINKYLQELKNPGAHVNFI